LGVVIAKKTLYIVFEFMEHASLSSVLADPDGVAKCSKKSGGTSSGSRAFDLQWVLQVARGLQFLHCLPQPLLHEELKSSNIMIDASYNAKVANFALESRVIGSGRDQGSML
jgi:serine/threonine protein kinase